MNGPQATLRYSMFKRTIMECTSFWLLICYFHILCMDFERMLGYDGVTLSGEGLRFQRTFFPSTCAPSQPHRTGLVTSMLMSRITWPQHMGNRKKMKICLLSLSVSWFKSCYFLVRSTCPPIRRFRLEAIVSAHCLHIKYRPQPIQRCPLLSHQWLPPRFRHRATQPPPVVAASRWTVRLVPHR